MCLLTRTFAPVLAVCLTACGAGDGPAEGAEDAHLQEGSAEQIEGTLLVSAAASLADAFRDMERAFESAWPGVDVVLNLGGSSSLRAQILEGAPVDVFAPANTANMDLLVEAGEVPGEPSIFARNALQIAVAPGNPAGIRGLSGFGDPGLRLGLCARSVPCGDFARQALERAGVVAEPDTREPNVRSLLTKVELGELDAGITYVTDIRSAGGAVEGVAIPPEHNVVAAYPIAVLSGAPNPGAAVAFVHFVLSAEGRTILARHGFREP